MLPRLWLLVGSDRQTDRQTDRQCHLLSCPGQLKKRLTRQKVFPHPNVRAPSASNSPCALSADLLLTTYNWLNNSEGFSGKSQIHLMKFLEPSLMRLYLQEFDKKLGNWKSHWKLFRLLVAFQQSGNQLKLRTKPRNLSSETNTMWKGIGNWWQVQTPERPHPESQKTSYLKQIWHDIRWNWNWKRTDTPSSIHTISMFEPNAVSDLWIFGFAQIHRKQQQGCISCGILVSGIRARGVSSEHMENMEMFSCSPT